MNSHRQSPRAEGPDQLSRRDLLKSPLALAATPNQNRGPAILIGETNAVVETASGKVRGYTENGVQTFKGIPYAESTAGQARFQPPLKPKPWSGIRDSLQYGSTCPFIERTFVDSTAFFMEYDSGRMREDCLNLNIWTPGRDGTKKRPVLFWLHGGGLISGSSQELKAYDGANLARHGDVVVVSINHRLNGFGFLNLTEMGDRYAASAHCGMLDIIAALEWVRDNISQFGGDPGNVTIFGWSGGGAKVNFLMAMPAAKGLFHKAIAQSPIPLITKPLQMEQSLQLTSRVLRKLGLVRSNIHKIHELPAQDLLAATLEGLRASNGLNTAPVADGKLLPANPFHPEAPAISANIPLLIGNTARETGPCLMCNDAMSDADLRKRTADKFGNRADGIMSAIRAAYPNDSPFDLWSHINFFEYRDAVLLQAERKTSLHAAPVFIYRFGWKTPVFDAKPRAFHGSELPFAFDNVDRCIRMTGGTKEAHLLAAKVSQAWLAFARTGNPSHKGLPAWPAVTYDRRPTMFLDNRCELKIDHDQPARLLLTSA